MATAPVLKALTELTAPLPGAPSLHDIDSGLVFDYDPAILLPKDDATNVNALTSKRGKIGKAGTLTAAPGVALPAFRTDGHKPGLSFNSSNALQTPVWNAPFYGPFTIAVVARATSVANSGNMYSGRTHPTLGLGYATANFIGVGLGASNQLLWNQPLNNEQYYLFTAVFDGAKSRTHVNDKAPATGTTGGGRDAFIPGFTFGSNASASSSFLNGRILRSMAWDRALTPNECAALARKLMAEYGL